MDPGHTSLHIHATNGRREAREREKSENRKREENRENFQSFSAFSVAHCLPLREVK